MQKSLVFGRAFALATAAAVFASIVVIAQTIQQEVYKNEPMGPEPRVVDPGPPGGPPSDAVVLFNGRDLSQWARRDGGGDAKWEIRDGAMSVVRGAGDIITREEFGDAQLHLEWAAPAEPRGQGQGRGNSGVFLMGRYEVQVLDSYNNKTYVNGQAGSIYKQYPPLVNVSRPPGQWQTYDIIFHAPRFDDWGNVTKRATVTVLHNGVLVQDHVEVQGRTTHDRPPTYEKHPPKGPIVLQDHGDPVRFRNIWIRPLS